MGCNDLRDVESVRFCDGTYMGPGASFDISSGQAIDITSSSTLTMSSTGTGAPRVLLDATAGSAEVRADNLPVRLRRYSATGATLQTDFALNAYGQVTLTAPVNADNAILRLENGGGKFGQIIASETGGFMAVQAESGYTMLVESTQGNVNISAANPDTTLTASVNGGSVQLTLTDAAGNGSAQLDANASIGMNTPLMTIVGVNPADINQTLTTTFDPANSIQLTINDGVTGTGATIDMFNFGEMALSATGVLNQTADSANLSITNDLTMSATQTILSGGGVRFNQSTMNANPILSTNYAITYTQVGAFTRTLPAVTAANIGQKYIITNSGIGTLTLAANGTQLIYSNGTGTNTKAITPNTTYLLTAIQSTTGGAYGWSMVGSGAPPAITVQAATGTLTLTPTMDRATFILTGTSATQNIATSLVGVPSGYCVYLRNGNNAVGTTQDITITGAATATLYAPTVATNSSYVLLFWNGTTLTAYR